MLVPQIVEETGVSADYWNEYNAKVMRFQLRGLGSVAEGFREHPVRRYEQRFPPTQYEMVVTAQNGARVRRLDELSDLVNERFTDVSLFTEQDFKRVLTEVYELIYAQPGYFFPKA